MFSRSMAILSLCSFSAAQQCGGGGGGGGGGGCSTPSPFPIDIAQCNTGDAQCCNSVVDSTDPAATPLLQLLGITISCPDVLVGLDCTPIDVIGVGDGADCAQQPVCCENTNFQGIINIGCTPISL